jgi:hypothetical protein
MNTRILKRHFVRLQTFAAVSLTVTRHSSHRLFSHNTAAPSPAKGLAVRDNLHGGQQPIAGADVYLFAAGLVKAASILKGFSEKSQ